MSQTLLEMTKELVLAQIHTQEVTPEGIEGVLHSTYETLHRLQTAESAGGIGSGEGALERLESKARVDWKGSITKHAVRCLECGETFKQLSLRHLSAHDLDPRAYRVKYHIPRTQALSARELTARRRDLAQQIRPWELASSKRQADSKAAAKPRGKAAAATPAPPRTRAKKTAAKK